jgi:hypothetical protein
MMKAYELLDSPEKLCKGTVARNPSGQPVNANDPDACQWCAIGAILACYGASAKDYEVPLQKLRAYISARTQTGYISEFSDDNDFETVRGALIAANV